MTCELCKRGFPRTYLGIHYGTQALGMIPDTPCTRPCTYPCLVRGCTSGKYSKFFAKDNRGEYGHVCEDCFMALPRDEQKNYGANSR